MKTNDNSLKEKDDVNVDLNQEIDKNGIEDGTRS